MLLRLFIFVFAYVATGSPITFKRPQSPNPRNKISAVNKVAIAAGIISGGYALKKFAINGPDFTESVDLSGKVAVITGGNTGLGKETAVKLASLGSKVYILCKNKAKGDAAVEEIKKRSNKNDVEVISCDLSSLSSIQNSVSILHKLTSKIDIIINNAGVMAIPTRTLTSDGFEAQMGINHLGHFALVAGLIDLMKVVSDGRIITVSRCVIRHIKQISLHNVLLISLFTALLFALKFGSSIRED
jgi:hypothetical protein